MFNILRKLVQEHGIEPNLVIAKGAGKLSAYRTLNDTIYIFKGEDNYAEQVFTLLHEYRHAMQFHLNLFPDMMTVAGQNAYSILGHYNVPWEMDANDWAYHTGIEMGYFLPGFKPRWLYGVALGDQGAC